jgi:hypothetical protein
MRLIWIPALLLTAACANSPSAPTALSSATASTPIAATGGPDTRVSLYSVAGLPQAPVPTDGRSEPSDPPELFVQADSEGTPQAHLEIFVRRQPLAQSIVIRWSCYQSRDPRPGSDVRPANEGNTGEPFRYDLRVACSPVKVEVGYLFPSGAASRLGFQIIGLGHAPTETGAAPVCRNHDPSRRAVRCEHDDEDE